MALKHPDNDPTDAVIHHIKSMLQRGELAPGSRLPAERKLAEALGVGRTHVRNALQKLEFYGIVQTFPQSGWVIARMKIHSIESLITDVLKIDEYDFRSLVEMRVILETQAIRLCALNRTDEEIALIKAAMQDFLAHFSSPERVEKDLMFHRAIAGAAHNSVLGSMLLVITPDILRQYEKYRVCTDADQKVIAEHELMIRCIEERDADRAEQIMREHLANLVSAARRMTSNN
ncbi:MAG: FadR family transcriptional regulator [Rikenellaceae bacterium]|jgi:DNA-binding FadR family transcriptional regulator|nr:FadR family transcriptional regulator [Rikenellaceae bacterium]